MARRPIMGPFDYVLRDERELPADEQTIWHLRTLTHAEYEEIERGERVILTESEGGILPTFTGELHAKARKILNFGLVGYTNYDGTPARIEAPRRAEGSRSILTSECLDAIEPYQQELAGAIERRGKLTKEARKNS